MPSRPRRASSPQENKAHYMGPDANPTRRMLYNLWRQINNLEELLRCVQGFERRSCQPSRSK